MAALQPRMQQLGGGMGKERSGMAGKGRLSSSGGAARGGGAAPSQDERFQLQQFEDGEPRPFAMAIRLTPDLLNDLKSAQADGSACLMKFGVTPAGHVLKIGEEEFKFNSAREDGGLCDIFEEQRRGEDGNGVLKEAGSVWRKLSVLRTLNASEKDRVKKRSVEAQQMQKSRKAIILDPTHSQNLTQNAPIAGDAMGRRPPMKTKLQPPRKKLRPTSPVRSPAPAPAPVPVQKPVVSTASAIASAKAAKAASVASPELPLSGRAASLPPPPPNGMPGAEEGITQSNVQMDNTPSPATTTPDTVGPAKPGAVVSPSELRNCLITLLTENPKGMTLKAVEKALGDSMPHVKPEKKTIEKAIRAIASYHAPGKYILKEGMTFAKPSPNSGSSPEDAAADSPPLADSPALQDMSVDGSTQDQMPGGSRRSESGLLGDKPGSLHSSAAGKAPSIVQKSSENAISRAIRKASETYQKPQPQSQPDHIRSPPAQIPESRVTQFDVDVDIDDVDVGGDESGEIEIIEGEGCPDLNGDAEVESVPDSSKEKAMPARSGGSESSSSSGSSDSDSESSDSGDSRSGSSGSGSDSDSDGSSSDSDDDNMDEDVEIVSDDDDEDAGQQKPKANDKKKPSHQSKDAKRAKLKPPEKLQTQESEEIDIGGDEGSGQPMVDPEERATVVVENLDIIDDEVDVVSVGDDDSLHEMGSVSPERQTADVAGAPADVEDDRDLLQKSTAKGNDFSLSKEEPAKTGEAGTQRDESLGKPTDAELPKAGTLKARINSMANHRMLSKHKSPSTSSKSATKESPVHTNNRLPARESSPSRPESGARSLLGSPALRKDGTEVSPRRAKDNNSKRKTSSDARKSVPMDGKSESDELVDKLVEAPMRPWPRPGKSAHPSQSFNADATPESGVRGFRDGEGSALAGRESDAETLPSVSRPGSWRHNPDGPGLLGKPGKNVEYLGRVPGRETEANVPSSRHVKNMRRGNNDSEGARRHEPMNDSDSWGKPARDLDGPRLGNDSEVMVNRLREGRKELTRSEGAPKASSSGGFNRQNDKKGRDSPDRESGEWRESTPGVEQMDMKGTRHDQGKPRDVEPAAVSRPVPNKTQNRELRKPSPAKAAGDFSKRPSPIKSGSDFRRPSPSTATGDLRKPSPVKPVGDFRKPSPAKAAGDIRKPSPANASNAQKLAQIAQKELQKIDNRAGKPLPSSQVEERPEGGSSRNGRPSNDTFERPIESRGVKRQLDEGSSEPPRVYKKPSIAPVVPSLSLNRDSGAARPAEKKQLSPDLGFKPESGRGGSSETPGNLAGPSAKAPSGENGLKQRPLGKGQKSSAKDGMEPPKGRGWKAKNGAGLLGPGGDRRRDSLQSDPGLSNGKRLKSSSSPEEVSGKDYFAKFEKDSPDLRGPIRSYEEAEAYRKEYQSKYPVYYRLYNDLEKNGGNFNTLKRELLLATSFSDKQQISTKVRREFHAIRKEVQRMQKTFDILQEELQTIKQHLRNFGAGKAGQV